MIPVLAIFPCLLTSLVTSGPLNTVITRGVGPHKTSSRQLSEYQDQDTYFIPSKRYEESDQTAMMDSYATKYQEYSPYATTEESPLSSSPPTEKTADYQVNKVGFGDYEAPSMMGQVIRMGRAAMQDMMPVMMPAMVPVLVLALYIGANVIATIVAYIFGFGPILSSLNQVMRA